MEVTKTETSVCQKSKQLTIQQNWLLTTLQELLAAGTLLLLHLIQISDMPITIQKHDLYRGKAKSGKCHRSAKNTTGFETQYYGQSRSQCSEAVHK